MDVEKFKIHVPNITAHRRKRDKYKEYHAFFQTHTINNFYATLETTS